MIAIVDRVVSNCFVFAAIWCFISHESPRWISTNKQSFWISFPWFKVIHCNHHRTLTICARTIFSVDRTKRASPLAKAHEQRPRNTHRTLTHTQAEIQHHRFIFTGGSGQVIQPQSPKTAVKSLNPSWYYGLNTNMLTWTAKALNTYRFCLDKVELYKVVSWFFRFPC